MEYKPIEQKKSNIQQILELGRVRTGPGGQHNSRSTGFVVRTHDMIIAWSWRGTCQSLQRRCFVTGYGDDDGVGRLVIHSVNLYCLCAATSLSALVY